MGCWQDVFEDLNKDEFQEQIIRWLETVDREWILEAEYEGKVRPVGLVLAEYRAGGRGIEPHVDWFPWATPRIKLEASAHYFREIRREFKVFVYSTAADEPFWQRLRRHRLIQFACKIPDYFSPGEDAIMFCTQGPFA